MYIFFLYFYLNKYFLGSFFNFIKIFKSVFFNFFYLIEYIFLFVFNFYFFYFLILLKFLRKEKYILKKKSKELKFINNKIKQMEKKSRIQFYLNKFWYYYYRRWMYKGWFLFFIGMKRWELRQFKYYLIYVYHNKVKRKFILFKNKILGSFFTFFVFNNFFLVNFYKKLRNLIFFIIYFLICFKMYSITFLKIKVFCIYRRFSSFIKNREFKQVRVWFKVKKK